MNLKVKEISKDINDLIISHNNCCFTALYDFSASPYALGDILTWNIRVCVEALKNKKQMVDIHVLVDPDDPSNRHQSYIISSNYHKFLLDIYPAFFANPMLRDIHLYQNRSVAEKQMYKKELSEQIWFPGIEKHRKGYRKYFAVYNSHKDINGFFEKQGYIPQLRVPESIGLWAQTFLKSYNPNSFFVCVHLRRRRIHTDQAPAEFNRDANFDEWLEFFDIVRIKYPDVVFIVLGRPVEWPKEFFRRSNILILKSLGYGLIEELAIIHECDLFMATNSGPAVMAIFGPKPYLILQGPENAEFTANLYGVESNTERLPFANKEQTIQWGVFNKNDLIALFDEKYNNINRHQ